MATTQIVMTTLNLNDGKYISPTGQWAGTAISSNTSEIETGKFLGYCLNWNGFNNQQVLNSISPEAYAGYSTNFDGININGAIDSFQNEQYTGYTTNWGKYVEPVEESVYDVDKDTTIDHPKDQTIYYKLRGWNPLTSTYESWVISQNITARPALDGGLFDPDPGRQPPNIERDVFKTPPSGNTLTGIIIVSRWIE